MTKRIHNKLICLLFVILLIFSLFGGVGGKVYASFENYTDVLADLQKDKNFNINDYPAIENNYSLQVITIAESTDGELFVYVYQPSANVKPLTATQINMSLTEDFSEDIGSSGGGGGGGGSHGCSLLENSVTDLYNLTLINLNGVFAKYKVADFTVSNDFVRYYNIISIYRKYNEELGDTGSSNESILEEKAFEVGKLYEVETVNGKIIYRSYKRDVVLVSDLYFGSLRYENGFSGIGIYLDDYTDSHYIAFSTDWDISDLYDVDVSFCIQNWEDKYFSSMDYELGRDPSSSFPLNKEVKISIKVDKKENGNNAPSGWCQSKYYSWNRIQTLDNFKNNCGINLSEELQENLKGKQWVLRFYESNYSVFTMGYTATVNYTKVTQETILRLHFKSHGQVYNLGAVSDMGHSDNKPDNEDDIGIWAYIWRCIVRLFNGTATLTEQIVAIVVIFLVVLALPILLTVLSFSFPAFGAVMKKILKGICVGFKYFFVGLWYVVSSPVLLVILIVHKKNGG